PRRRASAPAPAPLPNGAGAAAPWRGLTDATGAVVELAGTLASFALAPVSTLPFHGSLGVGRRLVWADFDLDDLLAIRGVAECKLNDVVLAIVAGALRRDLERRGVAVRHLRVRALVPVSVRTEESRLALGNLVTA